MLFEIVKTKRHIGGEYAGEKNMVKFFRTLQSLVKYDRKWHIWHDMETFAIYSGEIANLAQICDM